MYLYRNLYNYGKIFIKSRLFITLTITLCKHRNRMASIEDDDESLFKPEECRRLQEAMKTAGRHFEGIGTNTFKNVSCALVSMW